MTKEDKELLLKDLCARLPYGVFIKCLGRSRQLVAIHLDRPRLFEVESEPDCVPHSVYIDDYDIDEFKPYLRPLSSMTDAERKELSNLVKKELNDNQEDDDCLTWVLYDSTGIKNQMGGERFYFNEMSIIYDWLNAHHFDYRGLIKKGLALEAPEGMYDLKEE